VVGRPFERRKLGRQSYGNVMLCWTEVRFWGVEVVADRLRIIFDGLLWY